jgi:hypothetical protein
LNSAAPRAWWGRLDDDLMEGTVLGLKKQGLSLVAVALTGAMLAGCANNSSGRAPVGFAAGDDCHSVKHQLDSLVAQGVPGIIQSQSAGASVSGASKAKIDRYNSLLEEYLGNDCQLPPST